MTWVVGMPTMFGYAVGMSDIQVMWPDGRALDCVQKIYPVGNFLAAGFCGSVKIGFTLIGDLARRLNVADPGGGGWFPRYVAFWWYRHARRIFNYGFSPPEKDLGSTIMIFGASPQENLGDAPWARSDIIVLDSRQGFYPRVCPRNQCSSIGSGNGVDVYMRHLWDINQNPFQFMQVEAGGPGTGGFAWVSSLAMTLRENLVSGISEHIHQVRVWRGRVEVGSIEISEFSSDGVPIPRKMPTVARGWSEFETIARQQGHAAATACA
jgi:hypothetical protein